MSAAKLYLEVVDETQPAASAGFGVGGITQGPLEAHVAAERLAAFFAGMAGGALPGVIRVRTDTSTGTRATLAVTIAAYASFSAGDRVILVLPTGEIAFTAIVTGTPTAGDGTFLGATSNNASATSLAKCINTDLRCIRLGITASPSSAVVTISAPVGSYANGYRAIASVTSGTPVTFAASGAFAGGHDPGVRAYATLALSGAMSADDTVTIGGVVLTGKASPSGESQFAVGVSAAADGAALKNCINAHSKLAGIFLASGTSTVTVTLSVAGRIGTLILISKSSTAITLTGSNFTPVTTDTYSTAMVQYDLGRTPA